MLYIQVHLSMCADSCLFVGLCMHSQLAGLKSEVGGGRLLAPHLALALAIGLVAVGVKALTDSTVTGATHRVPPPAFGTWKVDSDGKNKMTNEEVLHPHPTSTYPSKVLSPKML